MITWEDFQEVFYDKYFSNHEKDRLDGEFRSLWQGSMPMAEYEATFSRLERFGQPFDSEECRTKRFMEGLNLELRGKVMGYRCQTLSDAMDLAARFEDDNKKNMESEPKGKRKMFGPQSYTPGMPSFASSGSFRKKRKAGPASHGRRSFAKGGCARFSQSRSSGNS